MLFFDIDGTVFDGKSMKQRLVKPEGKIEKTPKFKKSKKFQKTIDKRFFLWSNT